MNWIGCYTLWRKEVARFGKVWLQTIGAPVLTALLYQLIFAHAVGRHAAPLPDIAYTVFLIVYFVGFNILEASQPSMVSKIAPADLKGTAMGVYNTLQSIGLMSGFWLGGWLFQHHGMYAVLSFVVVLTLVWLASAAASPAPKPVKTVALHIGSAWTGRQQQLSAALGTLSGVEQISFSSDGETVYIKALQKGFDEAAAKNIISGE